MAGKYILFGFLLLHGTIHFLGWVKSLNAAWLPSLSKPIGSGMGLLWLFCALILLFAAYLVYKQDLNWWYFALAAIVPSLFLTSRYGAEARVGFIVNIALILAVIIGIGHWRYYNKYERDVSLALKEKNHHQPAVALDALPKPLLRYLAFCGLLEQPIPYYVKIAFTGEMADGKGSYFPFVTEQYDFFSPYRRLFFMKGHIKGLTVPGYHQWDEGKGIMDVSLMGWIPVVHHEGALMDQADAVTLLNDICLFAPHVLRKTAFSCEELDQNHVKVTYNYAGGKVVAMLEIDESGRLFNFHSDDRYDVSRGEKYHFSTPVSAYSQRSSTRTVKTGKAIWHYPEGEVAYGIFNLSSIEYGTE